MTLKQFIETASRIKPELLEKEVVIIAPNGMMFEPTIKYIPKDKYNFVLDGEHIEKAIITFD